MKESMRNILFFFHGSVFFILVRQKSKVGMQLTIP